MILLDDVANVNVTSSNLVARFGKAPVGNGLGLFSCADLVGKEFSCRGAHRRTKRHQSDRIGPKRAGTCRILPIRPSSAQNANGPKSYLKKT